MKTQLYAERKVSKKVVDGKEVVPEVAKVDPEVFKKHIRERIAMFDEVSQWLRLHGADSAMMFYLMAINGDEAGIAKIREYCPINACDERGLTAVDLALIGGEFEVAKLLHRHGGVPNTRRKANLKLTQEIEWFCDPIDDWAADVKLIVAAIEAGFAYKTQVCIPSHTGNRWDNEYCSLYAHAVSCAEYEVVEACLKNGADANEVLYWTREIPAPGGLDEEVLRKGTPWEILSRRSDMKEGNRLKFRELLIRYGAKIDEK